MEAGDLNGNATAVEAVRANSHAQRISQRAFEPLSSPIIKRTIHLMLDGQTSFLLVTILS